MKKASIAIPILCLLWTAVAGVLSLGPAATFASAIIEIAHVQQTITFQTRTGQAWTMPVADSHIMTQQITTSDWAEIDVEMSERNSQRITKITLPG